MMGAILAQLALDTAQGYGIYKQGKKIIKTGEEIKSIYSSLKNEESKLKESIEYNKATAKKIKGYQDEQAKMQYEFNKKEINNKLKQERQLFESQFTKKLEGKKKPKVLILMGLPGSYLAAGEKSYVGNLVKLAGGENIMKSNEEFSQLNLETALAEQPDFILRTAHAMPDEVMDMFRKEFSSNKSWQHFNAVKNNKVIDLDNKIFGMTAGFDYSDGLNFLYDSFYR